MGKELVLRTLKHEETEGIPWVPFAGIHAGKLKNYTAEEILKDGDKLFESLMEVKKMYNPDGMPIVFDLQIEAEIFGCELKWAKENPPSVRSHPFAGEKKIPCNCLIPTAKSGRIPMVLDVMRRVKAEIGGEVALYGLICGPFTLASHLRGSDIFTDMVKDKQFVKELVGYCSEVACRMADLYLEAGMDVIAVVDPLVSQASPKSIESMMLESFKAVFDYIRSKGALSSFFVCGNATNQLEVMCKTYPDSISVDENVNLLQAKTITDKYNIAIGGNIPLTTTMLYGTQQDNMKYVLDLMDSLTHKNLIISPGCDMPYSTPIQNTVAAAQAVKRPEDARKLIENYTAVVDDIDVELADYQKMDKVLLELFLLDPEQCAACTYMLNSVKDAFDEFKEMAEYRVYKYTVREDIARTGKMGITNLPTMTIDGDIKWVSIIPSKNELIEEVKKYFKKK